MTLSDEQRKQIEQEAEIEFPKNSDNDAFMGRELKMANQRGYIVAAVKYHLVFHQKDEEIARLRSVLEWYADPGNYLDENSNLATAWKMDENIANKAKEAIKK